MQDDAVQARLVQCYAVRARQQQAKLSSNNLSYALLPVISALRFNKNEDVASNTAIKSSHQRGIRSKLLEQMPLLAQPGAPSSSEDPDAEPLTLLDVLWPKKEAPALIKWCVDIIFLF